MTENSGLAGVPIGLNCTSCGKPITVDYIAHGENTAALVSAPMVELVKAAGRSMIARGIAPQLCAACQPV